MKTAKITLETADAAGYRLAYKITRYGKILFEKSYQQGNKTEENNALREAEKWAKENGYTLK